MWRERRDRHNESVVAQHAADRAAEQARLQNGDDAAAGARSAMPGGALPALDAPADGVAAEAGGPLLGGDGGYAMVVKIDSQNVHPGLHTSVDHNLGD
eukprot:1794499-Pyramimonas_sp.AAC.1